MYIFVDFVKRGVLILVDEIPRAIKITTINYYYYQFSCSEKTQIQKLTFLLLRNQGYQKLC